MAGTSPDTPNSAFSSPSMPIPGNLSSWAQANAFNPYMNNPSMFPNYQSQTPDLA